jgi:hypothetical protein
MGSREGWLVGSWRWSDVGFVQTDMKAVHLDP